MWEYKRLNDIIIKNEDVESKMKSLGKDGWEIFKMEKTNSYDGASSYYEILCKRKIETEKIIINTGTITFYQKDGKKIATFPLEEHSYHEDRVSIADKNNIKDWNHYTMHKTKDGMTKDGNYWIKINPDGTIKNYENNQ